MASPVDSNRVTTSISTAGTSHAINVGSPAAGTLLIVWIRYAGAPGSVTFTGYTNFSLGPSPQYSGDLSDDAVDVFYRWADGSEGATDTLTTGNSQKLAAICWLVTGAENPATTPPKCGGYTIGGAVANTCDPPGVNSGDFTTRDYLFLALGGGDGEVGAYTGAPTNYVNLVAANSGTGGAAATNCYIGGASRQLTVAATTENPGVFTHGAHVTAWTSSSAMIWPSTAAAAAQSLVDAGSRGMRSRAVPHLMIR